MTAPTPLPMSVRRELRLALVQALTAAMSGVTIKSPGDWPTAPANLPALLVSTADERKQSVNKGLPEFTTTLSLVVDGRVQGATAEAAQDAIEQLAYQVENAVLTCWQLVSRVNQFTSVQTRLEVTAEGNQHLAGFRSTFDAEVPEMFDATVVAAAPSTWPLADPALGQFDETQLHVDATNVYDASGTYPNPPFPASVTPAPRTTGPDGRDEGALDLQLPQS